MRCFLITCNGYKVVAELVVSDLQSLPALCRAWERTTNDGYAIYASHNGVQVATADGIIEPEPNDYTYQAGYAAACGYHD